MENVLADRAPLRLRRPARLLRLASDERLVAFVRGGDEGAFEALYDRHHPAILGFCRHMLGTREEAEDAVQHTFLAAFRDLVGSEKEIDLRPWLFAIARNRCLSLLRARRAHIAIELAEPTTDGLAATVERREDLRELLVDLAGLPEDQRAALLLAELGALDHAGIAAVLDCPREKVKALVFQARTSLAASREARATPCEQIRLELATASGAALRRGPLRRHLRTCAGCRAFKAEVATQHKLLALALPVVPTIALKASVLGGGAAATSSGTSSALGGVFGSIASTGAGKAAVSLAVAGTIAGGSVFTTAELEHRGHSHAAAASPHAVSPRVDPGPGIPVGTSAYDGVSTMPRARRVEHVSSVQRQERSPVHQVSGTVGSPRLIAPSHVPVPSSETREPGVGRAPAPPAQAPSTDPAPAPVTPAPEPAPKIGGERDHDGTAPPIGGTVPPGHEHDGHGHDGERHGHSSTPPGQSSTPPGHSTTPPGHSSTPPGHSNTPPGHTRSPGATESHEAETPRAGHGQSSHVPASSNTSDGGGSAAPPALSSTDTTPVETSAPSHGKAGGSHGQSGAHGHDD
jgi:RNA polymerase sigma factor (sigma-70 family)